MSLPDFAAVGWDDPFGIDTSVAHPARRYHYWLGGTDNFRAKFHSKNAPRQPTFAFSVPSPASTDTYGTERKDP